jgi:hypothetical protein
MEDGRMCPDASRTLTFETMLTDPLIRMVMDSDGVTTDELVRVMEVAREALVARELAIVGALHRAGLPA